MEEQQTTLKHIVTKWKLFIKKVQLLYSVLVIVAKLGKAHFNQFLLLSERFHKSSAADVSKYIYMWDGLLRNLY